MIEIWKDGRMLRRVQDDDPDRENLLRMADEIGAEVRPSMACHHLAAESAKGDEQSPANGRKAA